MSHSLLHAIHVLCADWSHDGKRILFLEKTYGDVYEVELKTGELRALSHHDYHSGYTRALYL
jgi:hypothetical protein